jgi:hypothetical protein
MSDSATEQEKRAALRDAIEVGLASELVECSYEQFMTWVRSGGEDDNLLAFSRPTTEPVPKSPLS